MRYRTRIRRRGRVGRRPGRRRYSARSRRRSGSSRLRIGYRF